MLLGYLLSMPFLMCRMRGNCSTSMMLSGEKRARWNMCMETAGWQGLHIYVVEG